MPHGHSIIQNAEDLAAILAQDFDVEDVPWAVRAIKNNTIFYEIKDSGVMKREFVGIDLHKWLEEQEGRAFAERNPDGSNRTYIWPNGMVQMYQMRSDPVPAAAAQEPEVVLTIDDDEDDATPADTSFPQIRVSYSIKSCDKTFVDKIHAYLDSVLFTPAPPPQKPMLYALLISNQQYTISPIATVDEPLVRENYAPGVLADFDSVVSEFAGEKPSARLVLMEGEPGTGKTFLIRALIAALMTQSKCVIIPPEIISELSGPQFLTTLLNASSRGRPMTLIFEDADDALQARSKRPNGKTADLSAILNLSDGLMGAALDLRIVATTNLLGASIDPALKRPGRMLKHIQVKPIVKTQAFEVYKRLTGGVFPVKKPAAKYTLAEIYNLAQQVKVVVPEPPTMVSVPKPVAASVETPAVTPAPVETVAAAAD